MKRGRDTLFAMRRPSIRTSCLFAVLALALPSFAQETAKPVQLHGHLRTVDGVDVLFLHGDDHDQAFTEGYLCADRLVALVRDFALSDKVVPSPLIWNMLVLPRVRRDVVVPDWVRARYAAMLEGMAAKDEALLEIPELHRDLTVDDLVAISTIPDFVGMACSSFVAWGKSCKGEGPLVGRNLDYFATPSLLKQTMVIVHGAHGDRAGWVSIGWPGFIGCLTGFSEHGVSVAIHDVPAKMVAGTKVTPRTIALQELIETWTPGKSPCEEAAALLRSFRFGMGGNAMVGWRAGEAPAGGAVYELWPSQNESDGVTPRGPDDGQTFVVCTNHHRARVTPEKRCWRYFALFDGLREAEQPFDMTSGWDEIGRAEVKGTLYRTLCDLHTGELRFELRREPRADEFSTIEGWNVYELLREAARGDDAASAQPEPAAAGSGSAPR